MSAQSIIQVFIFSILLTISLIIGIFLSVTEDEDEYEDKKNKKKLIIAKKIITYIIGIIAILFLCFANPQNIIEGILISLLFSILLMFLGAE